MPQCSNCGSETAGTRHEKQEPGLCYVVVLRRWYRVVKPVGKKGEPR